MQQTFKNNTPQSPLGDLGVRDLGVRDLGVNKKHNTPVPQRGD
jgi:hypothetical protein